MPSPVTGSLLVVALKPGVLQPGLLPVVISFMTQGLAYRTELMKPTGFLLMLRQALLISVMVDPNVGA